MGIGVCKRRSPEHYKKLLEIRKQRSIDPERFWSKVDKRGPDECWPWTMSHWHGYGEFGIGGKVLRAHRHAFELTYGPVPKELCVCHHCDNKSCCNPAHLFLGTLADNNRDRMTKGRSRPRKGIDNGRAKLSEESVKKIRELFNTGNYYKAELSRMFGVAPSNVGNIVRRDNWKHVA